MGKQLTVPATFRLYEYASEIEKGRACMYLSFGMLTKIKFLNLEGTDFGSRLG